MNDGLPRNVEKSISELVNRKEELLVENGLLREVNEVLSERIGFYRFWLWIVIFVMLAAAVLWIITVLMP